MERRDEKVGALVDQYLIEEQLGQGGCGDVYAAIDLKLDKKVAIKFIQDVDGDPQELVQERFYREIQALLKMNHPHIIQVFDFNMNSEYGPYYVMEHLQGRDLDSRLRSSGPCGAVEIYSLCQQLCSALHTIHQEGFVYRDLKPQNVFLQETSTYQFVKLLDFGLALSPNVERLTTQGHIVGSPLFMSPEQIMDPRNVDHRSDIYSFGMLLFHIKTGSYPYQATELMELLRLHCTGQPELCHEALRPRMKALLERLLAKNPAHRPADMLEVWELLKDVLVEEMQFDIAKESQTQMVPSREESSNGSLPDMLSYTSAHMQRKASNREEVPEESMVLEFGQPDWCEVR